MAARRFTHLSWTDRLKIEQMLKEGYKVQQIADALHVHNSTIYREKKRGLTIQRTSDWIDREVYCADEAERKYRENLAAKGPELKIGADKALAAYLEDKMLNEKYSPAAALAKIKEEKRVFSVEISEWTLYSYIAKGVFLHLRSENLPMGGKKKRTYRQVKASRAPKGDSIEIRPEQIQDRAEVGHWEMDTVESGRGSTRRLLVLTERATRKELMFLIPDGKASTVVATLDRLERKVGTASFAEMFKTITVDNGSEFQDCQGIERSCGRKRPRTHVYYCHPYSSYERGSNENCNRIIRRWFPKGMDFSQLTAKSVRTVERWINEYPREILGFRSANNLFQESAAAAGWNRAAALI